MAARVLCIDDSPTIRSLVKKALEPEGFCVVEAENGKKGLEVCEQEQIDFCIVDVNMPVIDGFEFVKALKGRQDFSSIPVVFLTTESSGQKKSMGKELGVKGWIVKPFEAPALVKVVSMFTGKK